MNDDFRLDKSHGGVQQNEMIGSKGSREEAT